MRDIRDKYLPHSLFFLRSALETALQRALQGAPEHRLTADECAAELRRLADALPTSKPTRRPWWARRRS